MHRVVVPPPILPVARVIAAMIDPAVAPLDRSAVTNSAARLTPSAATLSANQGISLLCTYSQVDIVLKLTMA